MSARERAPERRDRADSGEATAESPASKAPASRPPRPLLHPGLAFVSAGVCAASAGYLAATAAAFRAAFVSMGVELPWVTAAVSGNPVAVPAGLVVAGAAALALGGWRVADTPAHELLRPLVHGFALVAGLAACLCTTANILVFFTIQRSLQD